MGYRGESLPYDEIKFDKNVISEDMTITPGDSDISYIVERDLGSPDNLKRKTKNFLLCPEKKISPQVKFGDYMDEMKPNK